MIFKNNAPDDKEWSAHIELLNSWQNPERLLRDIVQYARSGPFYPADMHIDLIEQVFKARTDKKFCAVSEYGIEFVTDTLANVESWIGEQVADEDLPQDYYSIVTHTQAELDVMPED